MASGVAPVADPERIGGRVRDDTTGKPCARRSTHDLGKLAWKRACEVVRDVASALAFFHARCLLHRYHAPRDVRCTSDGRAKLIDFGLLATAGITGDVAGTPPYMAPEVERFEAAHTRMAG